nr:hypothetical protein [Tanacetum cinerariifolium]
IKDYQTEKIDIRFRREYEDMIDELKGKFNGMSIEINKKKELQRLEQERTIPLRDIISQLPPSIVITTSPPVLPIEDPEISLIMGNEELSIILEKESDEFIKSSVKDLVPILKDTECKDSYDSNLDESTFLVTPLSDFNEDGYFAPSDDVVLLLHHDPYTPKMSVVSILEGFQKKAHSKYNKSETDKILLDHGRLAYRCGSLQKGRESPGRNKTPGSWSACIPM